MFHPKAFRTYAMIVKILLMFLLIGFECVINLSEGDAHYMNQAAFQRGRSQLLVNAVYTLEYRPLAEQTQAMYELRSVLPIFEQEQTFLLTNPASDMQVLLQQAMVDYLPLIVAIQTFIAHANSVADPIEVNIIASHQYSYITTMNVVLFTLIQHFEERNTQLFVIQIVIEIVFLGLFLLTLGIFVWEVDRQKSGKKRSLPMPFVVRRLAVFALMFVLIGSEIVPLGVGDKATYLNQATLQRLRCEAFATSAFVLAYRSATEKTQALSDIQFTLPLFQQEQVMLLTNKNAGVHRYVQVAASQYRTMVAAVQVLNAQSGKAVDPVVINTIVSHASECTAAMNSIVVALQNQIDQQMNLIFLIEVTIEGVFIAFFGGLLLFSHDPFIPREQRSKKEE